VSVFCRRPIWIRMSTDRRFFRRKSKQVVFRSESEGSMFRWTGTRGFQFLPLASQHLSPKHLTSSTRWAHWQVQCHSNGSSDFPCPKGEVDGIVWQLLSNLRGTIAKIYDHSGRKVRSQRGKSRKIPRYQIGKTVRY
jgi:hypothetical protein